MADIDVTVIVPTYNAEQFLDECLTSIERNVRASIEVIVLNDGSTDGSLAIMRAHEQADPRIRVIDKPNQGYGATVNRGIAEARGRYIAIVEPDDYLKPGMYDALIALARRYGEPDIVRSAYWRVWMAGTPRERLVHSVCYRRVRPPHQPFTLAECPVVIRFHPAIWSALYRRDFLSERSIRFRELPGAGWVDNPFMMEAFASARSIIYTDDAWYCYREDLPTSSTMTRAPSLAFERWQDMADVLDRLDVRDRGIRETLYSIGFRHAGVAVGAGGLDDPEMRTLLTAMFSRMDPELVFSMDSVSPELKRVFCELVGISSRRFSRLPYLRYLAKEAWATLSANGPGLALARVKLVLSRRPA